MKGPFVAFLEHVIEWQMWNAGEILEQNILEKEPNLPGKRWSCKLQDSSSQFWLRSRPVKADRFSLELNKSWNNNDILIFVFD